MVNTVLERYLKYAEGKIESQIREPDLDQNVKNSLYIDSKH